MACKANAGLAGLVAGRVVRFGLLLLMLISGSVLASSEPYTIEAVPEWVERELTLEPAIAQAAVFGEARPWNSAVLVAADDADADRIQAAVARANAELPDYARVASWLLAGAPFTPANGLLTGTGRVRRQAVLAHYGTRIESLYHKAHAS